MSLKSFFDSMEKDIQNSPILEGLVKMAAEIGYALVPAASAVANVAVNTEVSKLTGSAAPLITPIVNSELTSIEANAQQELQQIVTNNSTSAPVPAPSPASP